MRKKLLITILSLVTLVTSFSCGVSANSYCEEIHAVLNKSITINYNGVKQNFADANGDTIYPISYNDTTYLPVRSVANLVNIAIEWDNETNTINLDTTGIQPITQNNTGLKNDKSETSEPEEIHALLNNTITIRYNGMLQFFTDENKNIISPISYNGTTYLPVRSVSKLANIPIEWVGETNTINLDTTGKIPMIQNKADKKFTNLTYDKSVTSTEYSWILDKDTDKITPGKDYKNHSFSTGIVFNIFNHSNSIDTSPDEANYSPKGMYFPTNNAQTLEFTAFSNYDNVTVYVLDENAKILNSFIINKYELKKVEMNISGISKVSFQANIDDNGQDYYEKNNKVVKIFEPIVYYN